MPKKGLGKALENALQGKEEQRRRKGEKSVLSNPARQRIYEYLTLHPCAYLSLISRDLLLSIHTLEWHLKKLEESGCVGEERIGGYRIYFPKKLVERDELHPLHLLNRENHRLIFSCIMRNPGMSMKDCSKNCDLSLSASATAINDLKADNLITSVEDGRFRRFFPSERIRESTERGDDRQEPFLSWLMDILTQEGLEPEIIKRGGGFAQISLKSGGKSGSMTVGLNPWRSILKNLS